METIIKNRYKIIRSIGSGGMSEVFLAHDEVLDRDVAVKRLKEQFVNNKEFLSQFNREAKSAAQLVHPNIVSIYDVIDDGKDQYIIMEFVDGCTLKELLKEYKIETKAAMQIIRQLADALYQAHSRKIIHCDIKSQNIIVTNSMVPKIADFGIAKIVSEQTMVFSGNNIMGSVYYLSPEQAHGEPVTAASDIYSLGIVFYEMLTGHVPFSADSPIAVAMMQIEKKPEPLMKYLDVVPIGLQEILDKMLAKNIKDRYASAGEVCKDIDKLLDRQKIDSGEDDDENNQTVVMKPVKAEGKKGKIISLSVDKDAMAKKAQSWKNKIKNHHYTFNDYVIITTVVVCLISLGAHFFFKHSNAMKIIPDVVNMEVEEARKYLAVRDYKVELQEENSVTEQVGVVLRQIPAAGEQRRRGSVIRLIYNVGAQKHTMPDLIDMSLVKAQQTLEEIGLQVGKVERKYNRGYRIGAVIEQEPRQGEKVGEGTQVNLIVNEGDKQLPVLIGKNLNEAERILRQLGLRVGEVRRVNSLEPKNTVTAISPEAGTMLPSYYPVSVTVSDGADKSVVGANFEFIVPGEATEKHRVQIYKIDRKGRNLIYSSIDNGGRRIQQMVDGGSGKVAIVVYCDGKQVQETNF
ncbi:MAG: Stk1 family PASTA domain-containing Ser/Thr kinase [Phascolarctobacterium sp.]|nr:Stk1 family PASTA domain-containing Ser/Thr kinase [Candidatus Phascolarctobacterium caballi]